MTKAKTRDDWLAAWEAEADCLLRGFQCSIKRADLYDELKAGIASVKATFAKIADALDGEGVFK